MEACQKVVAMQHFSLRAAELNFMYKVGQHAKLCCDVQTMQFGKALLLPANTSFLAVSKGVTVKLAQQAASGAPTPLLDVVPMDAVWSGGVTMFIDHARGSLVPLARFEGVLLDL